MAVDGVWKAWMYTNAEHTRISTRMRGLILSTFERGYRGYRYRASGQKLGVVIELRAPIDIIGCTWMWIMSCGFRRRVGWLVCKVPVKVEVEVHECGPGGHIKVKRAWMVACGPWGCEHVQNAKHKRTSGSHYSCHHLIG